MNTVEEFKKMMEKIYDEDIPMENIFAYVARRSFNGTPYRVNLEERVLGGQYAKIITGEKIRSVPNGNSSTALAEYRKMLKELGPIIDPGTEAQIEILEYLYDQYNNSYPSESDDKKRSYFKAKKADELTDKQLAENSCRTHTKALLESWILLSSVFGTIDCEVLFENNHWFWQSKRYPEFVILREWIDGSKVK